MKLAIPRSFLWCLTELSIVALLLQISCEKKRWPNFFEHGGSANFTHEDRTIIIFGNPKVQ